MGIFIPYLVLVLVAIVFYICCYVLFRDSGSRKGKKQSVNTATTAYDANYYRRDKNSSSTKVRTLTTADADHRTMQLKEKYKSLGNQANQVNQANRVHEANLAKQVNQSNQVNQAKVARNVEPSQTNHADHGDFGPILRRGDTMIMPAIKPADVSNEATQIMPAVRDLRTTGATSTQASVSKGAATGATSAAAAAATTTATAATIGANAAATTAAATATTMGATSVAAAAGLATSGTVASTVGKSAAAIGKTATALDYFATYINFVKEEHRELAEDITTTALQRLGITTEDQIKVLLSNVAVQEALHNMQKAYVQTPTAWMKESVIMAFTDVVREPKSSTLYLVAFDALRSMIHFTRAHFQVLSIALLFQYGCNSNNYSLKRWKHYVDKYVEPFLTDLPCDESLYGQLSYLKCIQEGPSHSMRDILAESYSYVFTKRGFTKDELINAMCGEKMPPQYIVRSLNSAMIKLAIVSPDGWERFFAETQIYDKEIQQQLVDLMESRPVNFSETECDRVLGAISPDLQAVAAMYDQSPLSRSFLTLLGLYIGRMHVKVMIGKDYDLSRWF